MAEALNKKEQGSNGGLTAISRSLIRKINPDNKISVYIKNDKGKAVLYTNDIEALKKRLSLPELFVDEEGKTILFENEAKSNLNSLQEKMDDLDFLKNKPKDMTEEKYLLLKKEKQREVAKQVSDWVEVSLDEIGNANNVQAAKHLKSFIGQLLGRMENKDFCDLMGEVKQLDYSTAQHSFETMIYMLNFLDSSPSFVKGPEEDPESFFKRKNRFIEVCANAALLHDIGKTEIDDAIILKSDILTDDERKIIETHPDKGAAIVKNINFVRGLDFSEAEEKLIQEAVLDHHEREDGKGYPNKKEAETISPIGKILGIIDVYAAMTSATRPYRKALSSEETIKYMDEELVSKGKLNREYFEIFKGSLSKLNR